MHAGYKFKQGSVFSEILSDLDGDRDNGANGIYKVLEAYLLHYDTVLRESAELLKKEFDKHGDNIDKLNYHSETLTIEKICESVNTKPELNNAAVALHLSDWFNYTNDKNNVFGQTHKERLLEEKDLPKEKTAELRKETTMLYQELVKHINAHITIKGTADYENIVVPVNKLIDEYNLTIARRSSSNDDNGEEEE